MTACEGLIPSDCNNPDCPAHAADRDDLAAILAKHAGWKQSTKGLLIIECDPCGHLMGTGPEPIDPKEAHRAHVAQMVLESDWLRGVRAKELRDAADAIEAPTGSVCDWGHKTEDDCNGECSTVDYVTPMVSAKWLRDRADRVDAEDTHTQPEAETEDRWCPTCQKYRPTIDDECTECGTDT